MKPSVQLVFSQRLAREATGHNMTSRTTIKGTTVMTVCRYTHADTTLRSESANRRRAVKSTTVVLESREAIHARLLGRRSAAASYPASWSAFGRLNKLRDALSSITPFRSKD